MPIYSAILLASAVLLLAFGVERLGKLLHVPSVLLLILIGLIGKPVLLSMGWTLDGLHLVVNVLGAIGLVLIVLEGALDISLERDRLHGAMKAINSAWLGFAACLILLVPLAAWGLNLSYFDAALVSVPVAVISSAVAIPSAHFLPEHGREFVVYESSISDIIGVLVFFALLNSDGTINGIASELLGGGLVSLIASMVCASGLALVLMRIEGQVRFIPLLAGLIGLYAAGKIMHLSPLIMVLLFGLTINNPALITRIPPLHNWMSEKYEATLGEFKSLASELTFAVRGFFFILLGYSTQLSDLALPEAWLTALILVAVIYSSRSLLLRLIGVDWPQVLLWMAPRGLITVLLFLSAREVVEIPAFLNGSVLILVMASATLILLAQRRAPRLKAASDSEALSSDTAAILSGQDGKRGGNSASQDVTPAS